MHVIINFPVGTVFEKSENTMRFKLPELYYALGIRENGEFARMNAGTVTCTCNVETGGCSPTLVRGEVGCAMSTCSNCTKSSNSISGETMTTLDVFNSMERGLVSTFEELDGKPMLDPAFIDAPEITKLLEEIQDDFTGSTSRRKQVAFLNVYGFILPVELPYQINNPLAVLRVNGGGSVECECVSEGSCPKASKLIATWCDATNCQSCSMTVTSIIDTQGNTMELSIENRTARLR